MGANELIHCELCKELTHPRANGDQICPKHPNSFADTPGLHKKSRVVPFKRKKTEGDL